jgi:hypothetical protein
MTAPFAYNRWQGNDFIIPGLPVRPVYAPALNAGADSGSSTDVAADTLRQLGFRVDGNSAGDTAGQAQQNARDTNVRESKSVPDMLTSMAQGFGMISGPLGVPLGVMEAARLSPERQANPNFSWSDLARSMVPGGGLFDLFGGGQQATAAMPAYGTYAGEQTYADPNLNGTEGGPNIPGTSPEFGADNGDMYFRGGTVKQLRGPNPPGPDDGFGGLQRGEEVVSKENVRKLKGKYGPDLFDMVHKGRLPARR